MSRKLSAIAPEWWDYTTLDDEILRDAAALTPAHMAKLSRPGFKVLMYDTLAEFYLAEALEYITAWQQSTPDNPVGICGPIGPTEQLPLVARLVNDLNLKIQSGHFWGMDEWFLNGREATPTHPLSFEKADRELCFSRIRKELATRVVDLHPLTIAQNARTSGGGNISLVPTQAISVGPVETWQADKVSIWHAGNHDNPFGPRPPTLMISQRMPDAAVPMSLLADHPNVQFNFYRPGIGVCDVEMH